MPRAVRFMHGGVVILAIALWGPQPHMTVIKMKQP